MQKRTYLTLAVFVFLFLAGCGSLPEGVNIPESEALRFLERKSGLIAYMGADGNIYTIDQGGGNQYPITQDAGRSGDLRNVYQLQGWDPASERVLFFGFVGNQRFIESGSVFSAKPDGSELETHYTSAENIPLYSNWSPNGNALGMLSTSVDLSGYQFYHLSLVDQNRATRVEEGPFFSWAWEPTGDRVAAHVGLAREDDPEARISLIDSLQNERVLGLEPSYFGAPAWSPDGFQLLFAIKDPRNGKKALVLTGLQGTIRQTLANFEDAITFRWSPDGKYVSYIDSDRSRGGFVGPLHIINPLNTQEHYVIDQDLVMGYFWSPESDRVAYITPRIIPRSEDPTLEDLEIFLTLYVYDIKREKSVQLSTFAPTREFLEVLGAFDQYQHSVTIWSPDGEKIVMSGYALEDGRPGIWVMPSSGNVDPRYIADGVLAFWSWE